MKSKFSRGFAILALVALSATAGYRSASAAELHNPGAVDIADPSGCSKVYAVSDIHGQYDKLVKLLQAGGLIEMKDGAPKWTGGKSLLVVVGDSIDKGPKSIEVVDLWMDLTRQADASGGRVLHLLGNHELEFMADPTNHKTKALQAELQAKGMPVDELASPEKPRGEFLANLPAAARIGTWFFSHAGLYPDGVSFDELKTHSAELLNARQYTDEFLMGKDSMLEAKKWWKKDKHREALLENLEDNGMYGVVQGHQPSAFGIEDRIGAIEGGRMIKIDNGLGKDGAVDADDEDDQGAKVTHTARMLRFENPKELTSKTAVPAATIINEDGSTEPLVPQEFTKKSKKERGVDLP